MLIAHGALCVLLAVPRRLLVLMRNNLLSAPAFAPCLATSMASSKARCGPAMSCDVMGCRTNVSLHASWMLRLCCVPRACCDYELPAMFLSRGVDACRDGLRLRLNLCTQHSIQRRCCRDCRRLSCGLLDRTAAFSSLGQGVHRSAMHSHLHHTTDMRWDYSYGSGIGPEVESHRNSICFPIQHVTLPLPEQDLWVNIHVAAVSSG
jgi:hypothetical protein